MQTLEVDPGGDVEQFEKIALSLSTVFSYLAASAAVLDRVSAQPSLAPCPTETGQVLPQSSDVPVLMLMMNATPVPSYIVMLAVGCVGLIVLGAVATAFLSKDKAARERAWDVQKTVLGFCLGVLTTVYGLK